MAGCDGALLLHVPQLLRVAAMLPVIPGQNGNEDARGVMPLVPWCVACNAARHVGRSVVGMTSLSLRQMTPSMTESWFRYWWYSLRLVGIMCLSGGPPSSM